MRVLFRMGLLPDRPQSSRAEACYLSNWGCNGKRAPSLPVLAIPATHVWPGSEQGHTICYQQPSLRLHMLHPRHLPARHALGDVCKRWDDLQKMSL